MKKIVISLLFILTVGSIGSIAQTKPSAPILDQSSDALMALELNLLGSEVSLNGGTYIYRMDSTAVASAATGDYAPLIEKVIKSIQFEYSSPKYLSPIPIKFTGSDCLVFRFSSSSVFNENKFSDRELAQRICSDMILPVFYKMSDSFDVGCPKFIGIGVAYKTKDFTEKYDVGNKYSLVIIASKDSIKKLFSYEITDNKFLENCFILLYKGTDGKRIEIKL